MTAPDRDQLLDAAQSMTGAMDRLGGDIRSLQLYGRRNRHLIKLVGVSVAFDIMLSAGLYLGFRRADDASRKASRASSTQVVNCVSGNESRRIQAELWNTVLQFPAPATETPEAKTRREAQTATFKDYIAKAFAPHDCSKVE